jgi:phosphotriesterase-related protein
VATIRTVLGEVDAGELGVVSIHEHLTTDVDCYRRERPDVLAEAGDVPGPLRAESLGHLRRRGYFLSQDNCRLDPEHAAADLDAYRAGGGGAVVEVTGRGAGRDIPAMVRLSERTGVHVIASTGLYIEATWPADLDESEDGLAAWMIGELTEGIDGTDVRAGHIGELGITDLGPRQRALLRAAARASAETGAPVSIHPGWVAGCDGNAVWDELRAAGMTPDRLVIGHADAFVVEHDLGGLIRDPAGWTIRLDYHRALLDQGVLLSFDCFGHDWDMETRGWIIERDVHRLAAVYQLVDEGYGDRLLLGTDTFCQTRTTAFGGDGYQRLVDFVAPALRDAGLPQDALDQMLIVTPRRLLAA